GEVAAAGSVEVAECGRVAAVEGRDVDQTALVPPLPRAGDRIERDQRLRQLAHLRLLDAVSDRQVEPGPVPAHGRRRPYDAAEAVAVDDRIEGPELLARERIDRVELAVRAVEAGRWDVEHVPPAGRDGHVRGE